MANLIPPYAKKGVVIEYWIRVVSVWLFLLSAVALAVAALNVPSYILIQSQKQVYQDMFADANDKSEVFTKIEHEIIRTNDIARLLALTDDGELLHAYVPHIESLANDRVRIDSFDFTLEAGKPSAITISGIAEDRESLVNLSDTLEADDYFVSADIPLSNLAKDKDIPFLIKIVLANRSDT